MSSRKGGAETLGTRAASRALRAAGCKWKWNLSAQPFRVRLPQERMLGICPARCCRVRRIGTVDEGVVVGEDWRSRGTRRASASGRQPIPESGASGQEHAPWRSRTRPPDVLPVQACRLASLTRCGSLERPGLAAIPPCLQGVSLERSSCPSNRTARTSCLVEAASRSRTQRRWSHQATGRKTVCRVVWMGAWDRRSRRTPKPARSERADGMSLTGPRQAWRR